MVSLEPTGVPGVYGNRERKRIVIDVPAQLVRFTPTAIGTELYGRILRRFACMAMREFRDNVPGFIIIAKLQGVRQ